MEVELKEVGKQPVFLEDRVLYICIPWPTSLWSRCLMVGCKSSAADSSMNIDRDRKRVVGCCAAVVQRSVPTITR
jgi:hypothetical protein